MIESLILPLDFLLHLLWLKVASSFIWPMWRVQYKKSIFQYKKSIFQFYTVVRARHIFYFSFNFSNSYNHLIPVLSFRKEIQILPLLFTFTISRCKTNDFSLVLESDKAIFLSSKSKLLRHSVMLFAVLKENFSSGVGLP